MKENVGDLLFDLYSGYMEDVHTCIPGQIESYEGHTKRIAKIIPLIKPYDSSGNTIEIPSIDNVPVIFPGTKTTRQVYPLKKGDGVLLFFSEVGIGNFLKSPGVQVADDSQRFSLTDCIAIPGLWSPANAPTPPENDEDFFIEFESASIQIKAKTNDIIVKNKSGSITIATDGKITIENLTGKNELTPAGTYTILSGTEAAVLGNKLNTWITSSLIAGFAAHTHPAPGGVTGTPNSAIVPPTDILSVSVTLK